MDSEVLSTLSSTVESVTVTGMLAAIIIALYRGYLVPRVMVTGLIKNRERLEERIEAQRVEIEKLQAQLIAFQKEMYEKLLCERDERFAATLHFIEHNQSTQQGAAIVLRALAEQKALALSGAET